MDRLLSLKEAAIALGYHPNHLRRLLRKGVVCGHKVRNYRWAISQREVRRVQERQTERGRYQPGGW